MGFLFLCLLFLLFFAVFPCEGVGLFGIFSRSIIIERKICLFDVHKFTRYFTRNNQNACSYRVTNLGLVILQWPKIKDTDQKEVQSKSQVKNSRQRLET